MRASLKIRATETGDAGTVEGHDTKDRGGRFECHVAGGNPYADGSGDGGAKAH
jgi:hypothetical protein